MLEGALSDAEVMKIADMFVQLTVHLHKCTCAYKFTLQNSLCSTNSDVLTVIMSTNDSVHT